MRSYGAALATDADDPRAETGEQRLLAALLERAIIDARAGRYDALAWFASDETCKGSTGWCYLDACQTLGLDPHWARQQLAQGIQPRRPAMRRVRRLRAA